MSEAAGSLSALLQALCAHIASASLMNSVICDGAHDGRGNAAATCTGRQQGVCKTKCAEVGSGKFLLVKLARRAAFLYGEAGD